MNKKAALKVLEFWSIPEPNSGCHLWFKGKSSSEGYGRVTVKGKSIGAHRLSWAANRGKIPKGLLVCHQCDNPSCCNIDHLFLGTNKDNYDDSARKYRRRYSVAKKPHRFKNRGRLFVGALAWLSSRIDEG